MCIRDSTQGMQSESIEPLADASALSITTENLTERYPLFASSLLSLIQNAENRIRSGR